MAQVLCFINRAAAANSSISLHRCAHAQRRLSLSTDGDKCAMVNFLGGMNKKLVKHVVALYSLPIIFSKNFLARSLAFYPEQLQMQAHAMCFTNSIYIYFFIFGVIIPIRDCQLPKFTENTHKIAYKMSKNCLWRWG